MAKLPEMFLKTNFDEQRILAFQDILITINGKPLKNIVDCQLTLESYGKVRLDIIQDEFIYNLRE